jgi:Protein of unknown function (DUF3102)
MPEPRKTTQEPEAAEGQDQGQATITPIQPGMGGTSEAAAAPGQEILPPSSPIAWTAQITSAWSKSVDSILEVGRLLIEAKAELPHGEFQTMIDFELPFSPGTAQRLMSIGADPRLAAHVLLLPPSWGTLYELTKLPALEFDQLIADGTITPNLERRTIEEYQREHLRDDAAPAVAPTGKRKPRAAGKPKPPAEQKEVRAVCTALQAMTPDQLRYIWKEVLPRYPAPVLEEA